MGLSINGGSPKWMVYTGKSHLEMDGFGVPPFWETFICTPDQEGRDEIHGLPPHLDKGLTQLKGGEFAIDINVQEDLRNGRVIGDGHDMP